MNANHPPVYGPKTINHGNYAPANLYDDGEVTCGACQLTIGFTFDKPFYADGISAAPRREGDAAAAAARHHESCPAR